MDKTIISKEITSLIDAIKNDFQKLQNSEEVTKQESSSLLLKINELNKKAAVWDYLQGISVVTSKPVEIKIPEPVIEPKPESIVVESKKVEAAIQPPAIKPIAVEELPSQPIKTSEPIVAQVAMDIKKKIAFNEKFEFINELFKGNAAEYDAAIAQLSAVSSKQDALKIYSDLKQNKSWSSDNEAAERLLEMIKNF